MKMARQPTDAEVRKFSRLARVLIEHHLGSPALRVKYQSSGLTNFVFAARHRKGEFMLRISPDADRLNSFIKEQWAQRAARESGVPVPEILEVGLDIISYPYMISTAADGVEATHHPLRLEILRELGEHAAVINSIRTTGFGETFDWSENRLPLNSSFKEYLTDEYCYKKS